MVNGFSNYKPPDLKSQGVVFYSILVKVDDRIDTFANSVNYN